MNAHVANAVNALVLIVISLWAYLATGMASFTALIPAAFGVVLLACTPGVKAQNKLISHIAALLTLIVLIALLRPFSGAINGDDGLSLLRISLMMLSSVLAIVFFAKSFLAARRRTSQKNQTP
ncbi:MAG: hypothetical protein AAF661_07215 [Pseudomonadota bacterium]